MNLRIVALCIAIAPLVACTSGGGESTETVATEGSAAAEPAAAEGTPEESAPEEGTPAEATSPQDACIAALATHEAAIQTLFDNTRSLHPQSEAEPVTPVADLRMNASEEQLAAIYGSLHGNAALISGSAAVRGAERPIRVSDGIVNLTYAWNGTFSHTVAGQEIDVKTGSVINTDTQEEFDACFIELIESYGDAGQATVELTIAR